MKILFLCPAIPPAINGVSDYNWNLVLSMRQAGIDAQILTSGSQKVNGTEKSWVYPSVAEWNAAGVTKAVSQISNETPDWCVLQYVPHMYDKRGLCWPVTGILKSVKEKFKCRTAVVFHEITLAWNHVLPAAIMHAQAIRLIRHSDAVITTCEEYARKLKTLGPCQPRIIPVGASVLPAAALSHKVPQKTVVFGMFGRLTAERSAETSLKVLKAAKNKGMDASLKLIGCAQSSNPKAYDHLMKEARNLGVENLVSASGELPAGGLSECFQNLDVFLFPQIRGISTRNTSALTAIAHGLPVVSYASNGGYFEKYPLPEGALVKQGREDLFIDAALNIGEKALAGQINKSANCGYFARYFSWETIRDQYLETLGVR